MTFEQYIQNPLGKNNAVFGSRDMYKNLYTEKLNKLLVREVGKVEYKLYFDKKNDRYYVYFKIPSEVIKDFYYDTVIEFYPNKLSNPSRSIKKYSIRFYSNDPSFVFTFAYSFNKKDMLINDLKNKLPERCLKERAVEKNPKSLIGYVKSLYFAYLLMEKNSLFNKIVYETTGFKYDKGIWSQVMPASKKIDLRVEAEAAIRKQKGIEKKKEKLEKNSRRNINHHKNTVSGTINTNTFNNSSSNNNSIKSFSTKISTIPTKKKMTKSKKSFKKPF